MKIGVTVTVSREDRPRAEVVVMGDGAVLVNVHSGSRGPGEIVLDFAKREQLQDWISMVLDALQDYDTLVAEKQGLTGEA